VFGEEISVKTKEVIRLLQQEDPSGEEEVCVGNVDVHFITSEPAYYDGALQVLLRDPAKEPYYNIVGGKYIRTGKKVVIHTLSISDAISNAGADGQFTVDYSQLCSDQAMATKKAHDDLREWHRELDVRFEWEYFLRWIVQKAETLTADLEDVKDQARTFFEKHVSPNDPLPEGGIPLGESYVSVREAQWETRFSVVMEEGFFHVKLKDSATTAQLPDKALPAP
jgi:hypothetical protein